MGESKKMKFMCLGNNPVTNAVGKVIGLFGVEACDDGDCDILVMADGDNYKLKDMKGKFNWSEKVIYIESAQNYDASKIHPLFFLSEMCETSRLQLENFSIVELAKIINEVRHE